MYIYSEEHILSLHSEFQNLKHYKDKVFFFDSHFGSLGYEFPHFQPELDILFKPDGINILSEVFEKERRNSSVFERRFNINGNEYIFNIAPINTNPQILNDYILSKFISSDTVFQSLMEEIEKLKGSDTSLIHSKLKVALNNIRLISLKLDSGTERSFRNRFMTVFYNGYLDYINNDIKKFSYRKKFIELFLYAQGILYGKYLESLNSIIDTSIELPDQYSYQQISTDWYSKIGLFKELGILQLLKEKYAYAEKNMEDQVAQLLCVIFGEDLQNSDKVKDYIRKID